MDGNTTMSRSELCALDVNLHINGLTVKGRLDSRVFDVVSAASTRSSFT